MHAKPPLSTATVTLTSAEQTAEFAAWMSEQVQPGDCLLLEGPIGAGKTHFCRSLIQSLMQRDGRVEDVPSPTFTLVQTYQAAGLELWHTDLYRLGAPEEIIELGLDEAFEDAVCLVEWPDRLGPYTPPGALTLNFRLDGDADTRILTLSSGSDRWKPVIAGLNG